MTMKLLHAFVALLTVLLVFARQWYTLTACPVKTCSIVGCESPCGDSSLTTAPLRSGDSAKRMHCAYYGEDGCPQLPKYKRDPDINYDNENLGTNPYDQ